jgi:curved DNA-binding protein CbpA
MPARDRFNRDYYGTLGVRPDANEEEIRKAYRRLAIRWHPDRNPGVSDATQRFQEISEAYAVLIDPGKRRQYDHAWHAGGPAGFQQNREDLFRELFANARASAVFDELTREFERMGMRVDRQHFHRTLFGGRTVVTGGIFVVTPFTPLNTVFKMARAAVRGARNGASVEAAQTRALPPGGGILAGLKRLGKWLIGLPPVLAPAAEARDDIVLPLALSRAEAQQGAHKRVTLERTSGVEKFTVTIPPGVRSGTKLRLRGKGEERPGGNRGDLYLDVEITEQ